MIIRQGQIADSFYFIISGQAMVSLMDEDKKSGETKNRILAVLKEGTCFGVSSYKNYDLYLYKYLLLNIII